MNQFEGMTEDAKAQLLRAKDMTRRTGTLIEAQMLQLRLWPQVVFKDILDAPDKATAVKFTENDPYVKAGLFSSIDVRAYRLTVGSVG